MIFALLIAVPPPGFAEYEREEYAAAAPLLYGFLKSNPQTTDDYERAEFLLAASLGELGFKAASAEYFYNVARNRTNPELLTDALRAIRDLMAGPHDEMLFERNLLAESELGRFPPELDSFVSFTKGLEDLRIHQIDWAERHFDRVDPSTLYKARSLYVLGVQRLRKGDTAQAIALLRQAMVHPAADRQLMNQVRLALARVLFEERKFAAALDLYGEVEVDALDHSEPTVHLEKAWAQYHLGNLKEAMGRLHALEAPSYRDFHAPEIYLLRALVYKDLCRYIQSKRIVRAFLTRFGETLDHIHARADLREDPVLRAAAMQRGGLLRASAFQRMIADESARLPEIEGGDSGLVEHLAQLYALKTKQVDLEVNRLLEEQAREVAEELIDFEEQMQLLDYELGLAIYQRSRLPAEGAYSLPKKQAEEEGATFEFEGEFWNDELDSYRFVLEDRCVRRGAGE